MTVRSKATGLMCGSTPLTSKSAQNGRIVSAAVIVAVGVNSDGRREVLGMDVGPSEAETFWTEFLRKLRRRGLRGVKLVISDAHEGVKAAVAKVMNASWQRCRVHFCATRSPMPARADAGWLPLSSPPPSPRTTRRPRARSGARSPTAPRHAAEARALMDEAEADVLAYMSFPAAHRTKLHSTESNRASQRRDQAANRSRRHLSQ